VTRLLERLCGGVVTQRIANPLIPQEKQGSGLAKSAEHRLNMRPYWQKWNKRTLTREAGSLALITERGDHFRTRTSAHFHYTDHSRPDARKSAYPARFLSFSDIAN
jgi:hypothetical protein